MTSENVEAKLARLAEIDERLSVLQTETTKEIEKLEAMPPDPLSPLEDIARYEAETARMLGRQEIISGLTGLALRQV